MLQRVPKKGDVIEYIPTGDRHTVDHVRDNICYEIPEERHSTKCFIVQFSSTGFNTMHRIVEPEEPQA